MDRRRAEEAQLRAAKLTGVRALEALVQLEGEGNVNLHHLHLRYARRMCYHAAATATEHQVVAVNAKYHHVPAGDEKKKTKTSEIDRINARIVNRGIGQSFFFSFVIVSLFPSPPSTPQILRQRGVSISLAAIPRDHSSAGLSHLFEELEKKNKVVNETTVKYNCLCNALQNCFMRIQLPNVHDIAAANSLDDAAWRALLLLPCEHKATVHEVIVLIIIFKITKSKLF